MRRKNVVLIVVICVVVVLAVVAALVFLLPGTGAGASAEGTVRKYFDAWGKKDIQAMDACLIQSEQGKNAYGGLSMEAGVTLNSVSVVEDPEAKERFDQARVDTSDGYALLSTSYIIRYNDEGQQLYKQDQATHTGYLFWLVKEGGAWRIARQGY
ncbi:DUF4829 domain-containing protein [Eubacteriales bacterium OttesenSCG-928-A19]|nr:DUF4829 domain-containing protein [Eubacteriales bacterium OttesenSCG-928-A19]